MWSWHPEFIMSSFYLDLRPWVGDPLWSHHVFILFFMWCSHDIPSLWLFPINFVFYYLNTSSHRNSSCFVPSSCATSQSSNKIAYSWSKPPSVVFVGNKIACDVMMVLNTSFWTCDCLSRHKEHLKQSNPQSRVGEWDVHSHAIRLMDSRVRPNASHLELGRQTVASHFRYF